MRKATRVESVAITIGRKTFHLFYLCTQCGNIGIGVNLSSRVFYDDGFKEKD